MDINWRRVREKKITDEMIQKVEGYFNIDFPREFVECIKKYDGGRPNPRVFCIAEQGKNIFHNLLTFDLDDNHSIIQVYEDICDRLPQHVYPFARDPFGNFICFFYKSIENQPNIVFWDHEKAAEDPQNSIFVVSDSFSALLNSLEEDEE
ncbi:SMI1/KNR4 family protein [Ectobacillus sp. JY-23]|uniref:SMI1/KNR4 family protein n=1 Tax=Ectobacillus sp. JY-23 TaxID=2933872 RepID=UPI001FF5472D|nr:SMI1/KNR4 family protein [Ectobacillus sp. JY-23]UOY92403.1 SMI1/KNR4 family protein [Ectobacillus sp. JY-23]